MDKSKETELANLIRQLSKKPTKEIQEHLDTMTETDLNKLIVILQNHLNMLIESKN